MKHFKKFIQDNSFIKNKTGGGKVTIITMGYILAILLLCSPLYVYAQCSIQVKDVKEISKNVLDVYTIKMG
ncbi:MAG: hypothetical protein RSE93_07845, partial [Oscillospiraceae bacterium]